ncbi:MAG: ATP-binding cassette domain-containing protein [Chromatiales bacterium]|nr:ATP-binding cassette domain-containing protein [Chromatiales bacterium]
MSADATPTLQLTDLQYRIDDRPLIDLADWRLPRSEHCLVLGPSGSGKTTLLHLLAGLLRPHVGRIEVLGQDIAALHAGQRDAWRGRHVGIVFQRLHLIGALTVAQNLRLARKLAGLSPDPLREREVLEGLGLARLADALPARLSQGEAQRAAIARAVVNRPALILADEPTSALDDANCSRVAELLLEQAAACGASLLIATHDARIKELFLHHLDLNGDAA